jgi:hypothetical protein
MAAASLVSDLFNEPNHWVEHNPDWATLRATFGAASGQDTNQVRGHLVNLAHSTPTVICFTVKNDNDHIYVCHSPTLLPGNPANATAFDNKCVVLMGVDLDATATMVLPDNCFTRRQIRASTVAYMTGVHGHGAAPAVFRHGPHAGAATDTTQVEVCSVFLMDPNHAVDIVAWRPDVVWTLLASYNEFIQPNATSGNAAQEAYIKPLLNWYRAACTINAGGHSATGIVPVTSSLPLQKLLLQGWVDHNKKITKVALGTGGPGLTSVAFNAGVTQLETAIRDTSAAAITYQREAAQKTFTEQYGASIAQTMYNLCNVADDEHLPAIHKLLAKSPEGGVLSGPSLSCQ